MIPRRVIFQEARIGYLSNLGSYTEINIGDGCGLIQSEATVRFINDMHQGDSLKVRTRLSEIRCASFTMSYQIYIEEKLMVQGETTLLALDYNTRKPSRLPASFNKAMKEFESK
jgi:acyl-CoA thioester hydrolase